MKPPFDIVSFTTDPDLLGLNLSPAQETLLRAFYGHPLRPDQLELWRMCTGRQTYPAKPFPTATVICGARSGKDSRIATPVVLYEAIFGRHREHLLGGELPTMALVAQDRSATQIAYQYVLGRLERSPYLRQLVKDEPLAETILLTNGVRVACFSSSHKGLRGYSIPVAVLDELAYYRVSGSSDTDVEIQTSILRGQIQFPWSRLLKITTPYRREGVSWDDYSNSYGQDDPETLVWVAPTALMNPTITAERLERERRKGAAYFAREFLAEFVDDSETFLPAAAISACVSKGVLERTPRKGLLYVAGLDPCLGGADGFGLGIVHTVGGDVSQDVARVWKKPPDSGMDLDRVVAEIAAICKSYGIDRVYGDQVGMGFGQDLFRRHGLTYIVIRWTKSECFMELAAGIMRKTVGLLDNHEQTRELTRLEQRNHAGGRVTVDHPSGGHDDLSNALAVAYTVARSNRRYNETWNGDGEPESTMTWPKLLIAAMNANVDVDDLDDRWRAGKIAEADFVAALKERLGR